MQALEADSDTQYLFEHGRLTPVPTVIWASSLGHAQTVQLPSLPPMLLTEGYRRVRALARPMTLQAYAEEVAAALNVVRQVARTGQAEVPAIVALRGGRIEAGTVVTTPYGLVRASSTLHRELGPPEVGAEVVLETSVPIHVELGDDLDSANPPEEVPQPRRTLRDRAAMLGEAAMLATGRPLVATWQTVMDPFAMSLRPTPEPLAFRPPLTSPDLAQGLETWSSRLHDQHTDRGVTLARGRLVNAMVRPDPEDALIDAVVAWEALFGDSQGELRFRIATSIAWLLAKDGSNRQSVFKQARDLYDFRSRIVHGGTSATGAEIRDAASTAISITWRCLRGLYERPGNFLTDKQARTRDLFLDLR